MYEEKKTTGFECPSCKGPICQKIDRNAKFPYQCVKCGLEYQTPPPSSTHNSVWEIIQKFFNMEKEE